MIAIYAVISGALLVAFGGAGEQACWPGFHGGWAACDQAYHLELINYFIEHPASFLHYPDPWLIANLPGFHVLIASIARLLGYHALGPDTWLRVIPFLFGLGVTAILWRIYRDVSGDAWCGVLLSLPILLSNYFFLPSLFLVTDTGAYLGYVFLLMGYLRFPRRGFAIGLAGAAMVCMRQIYLPVIATQVWAVSAGGRRRIFERDSMLALAFGLAPPIAVVLLYVLHWHGLVPPEVERLHGRRSVVELGPIVQAIGLLGVLAIPYGFLVHPALTGLGRRRIAGVVVLASAAALVLWLVAPTTRDLDAGRAGSLLWLLARISPAIGDHAVLALPVLALGCIAAGIMVELARTRRYLPFELIMLGLYVAALSMQLLSYERYSEVVTLITLSATAARVEPPSSARCAIFVAVFAVKAVLTIWMPMAG